MAESLGTARIELVVDTTQFQASIERAKNVASGLGSAAASAFQSSDAQAKRAATSLIRYTELLGKSADQQKLLRAGWAGTDNSILREAESLMLAYANATELAASAQRDLALSNQYDKDLIAANQAMRRADAVAGLTQVLERQDFIEAELARNASQDTNDNAAAQARRRADAVEGLTIALQRQDAEEADLQRQAAQDSNDVAAAQARRRADAVYGLTAALEKEEAVERRLAGDQAFIRQLQQTAQTTGKTRSEILELQAAERGLQAQSAPLIAQLRAQEMAMNGVGREAKQMQWAMRGLPAQITDITVSLAGGQNPLMVLLQQGGQLKDMFGGIRPAAAALGSSIAGMVNPLTIAGAGVAAFGVALYGSEKRMEAYTLSLVRSGNQANLTATQMRDMADALGDMDSVSQGGAEEALNRIVSGGKIAASQLDEVGEATARWASLSGDSVDDVVSKFEDIARDPVQALLKLNDAENFLTEAQAARIIKLQEEGREQELAREGINWYADTLQERASDVEAGLGNIASLWKAIKDETSNAWNEFMGFADWSVGVFKGMMANNATAVAGVGKIMNSDQGVFSRIKSYGVLAADYTMGIENAVNNVPLPKSKPVNATDAANSKEVRARMEFNKNLKSVRDEGLNATQQQDAKEAKLRKDGIKVKADALEVEKAIEISRAKFNEDQAKKAKKPGKGPSMRGENNADLRADLQAFKDILQVEQGVLQNSTKITEAEYSAKLISMEEYYRRTRATVTAENAAQEKALTGQIATLRARTATGADSINQTRQLAQLEAELTRVRAQGATELEVLSIREKTALRERENAYTQFVNVMERSTSALRADWDAQIARITMSERDFKIQQSMTAVYRDQTDALEALNRAKAEGQFDNQPGEFERRQAVINKAAVDNERVVREGYERQRVAQADWLSGVGVGLQNWMDMTADAAGQASQITNRAMESASGLLTEYLTTGQADVKAFLRVLLTEITNFLIKQAVMRFATMIAGMWAGGGANTGGVSTIASGASNANVAAKGAWFDGQASYFAKGGAFTNSIVNQPTPFTFANGGKFGVMGEAGPEAILPLKRGPTGKLGVEMSGGGGGSVTVQINTTIHSDGTKETDTSGGKSQDSMYNQFAQEVGVVVERHIDRSMMPNGKLWQAGVRIN